MAIEVKEILEYLGYDPEKISTIDDLKPDFEKTFVRKSSLNEDSDVVKSVMGRVFGSQENELKKIAKQFELDVDFDSDDYKSNKKLSEKANFILSKYQEKSASEVNEWKSKAGLGNDEKVKTLETKYEKAKREKAELEELLSHTKGEYENLQKSSSEQLKNVKIDVKRKDFYGKIKYKSDMTDLEKEGFESKIAKNYIFDIDENDDLIIKTAKGERIPSPKVVGTYKSPLEVLEEEATTGKIIQMNNSGGNPAPAAAKVITSNTGQQLPASPERRVAPRMA
jgi:hypothetical protein